jgi:trans-2,3-dihydro-3-hydroxyanthranilate isomerase
LYFRHAIRHTHTHEVRIFTPRAELPFAGHPNIGTAFVVATLGDSRERSDALIFEEKAGLVRLNLVKNGTRVVGARLAAPQPLAIGDNIASEVVAGACSISVADIEVTNHASYIASCGIPFVLTELKTRAALAAARPRSEVFVEHLKADRVTGILLYVRDNEGNVDLQARMFAPLYGIPEDPATGIVGFLARLRHEPDLVLRLRIAQGIDMGRPSLLEAKAEKRNSQLIGIWISGRCVPVMRGVLEL